MQVGKGDREAIMVTGKRKTKSLSSGGMRVSWHLREEGKED